MSSRPSRGAARLAAILDALPDALVLVNANGTVVNANTIALEALEAPGTALVGRGLLDLLPQFDSQLIPGSMRRPDTTDERGRTKPTRMMARRTDGSEFPVEVTSASLADGRTAVDGYGNNNSYGMYGAASELLMLVVRDLSGTIDTEAELARSQRQTEMILRAAAEGVVGTDTDGRIVLVNPAAAQILGFRASDLGGQELHKLFLHSRADGDPFPYDESPLADTLRSGRKHRVRGQVLWSKSGDKVPVDMTTAPVRDGDQLVGAVMTFTDRRPYDELVDAHAEEIERRDAEAARLAEEHAETLSRTTEEHTETLERTVKEHTETLESTVKEHTEKFTRTVEEHEAETTRVAEEHAAELARITEQHAEELSTEKDRIAALAEREKDRYEALAARYEQLLAVLGQSLRGPLDELRHQLTSLAADDAGQLWPEANQILHHLAAGYTRMTTLVDNVLGYQLLDSGDARLTRSKVMLDAVVAAGVEGAVELIGPGRAQFAVHAPPIEAEVDAERLATALAHLIADVAGIDATGNARVGVVPTVGAGGYVDSTVVVAAALRGESVRIEVRGPYTGGDPVHEPIVRGIVRAHGGVLQTHSLPGMNGSAYVLDLPIGEGAGVVSAADPSGAAGALGTAGGPGAAVVPGAAGGPGTAGVPGATGTPGTAVEVASSAAPAGAAETGSAQLPEQASATRGGRRRARRASGPSVDSFLESGVSGAGAEAAASDSAPGDGDQTDAGTAAAPTGRRRRRAEVAPAEPAPAEADSGSGGTEGSSQGSASGSTPRGAQAQLPAQATGTPAAGTPADAGGSGTSGDPDSGAGAGSLTGTATGTGRRRARPNPAEAALPAVAGPGADAGAVAVAGPSEGSVVTAAEHAAGSPALGQTVPPQGMPVEAGSGRRARRNSEQAALPAAAALPAGGSAGADASAGGDSGGGASAPVATPAGSSDAPQAGTNAPTGRRRRALAMAAEREAEQASAPRTVFALPPAEADRTTPEPTTDTAPDTDTGADADAGADASTATATAAAAPAAAPKTTEPEQHDAVPAHPADDHTPPQPHPVQPAPAARSALPPENRALPRAAQPLPAESGSGSADPNSTQGRAISVRTLGQGVPFGRQIAEQQRAARPQPPAPGTAQPLPGSAPALPSAQPNQQAAAHPKPSASAPAGEPARPQPGAQPSAQPGAQPAQPMPQPSSTPSAPLPAQSTGGTPSLQVPLPPQVPQPPAAPQEQSQGGTLGGSGRRRKLSTPPDPAAGRPESGSRPNSPTASQPQPSKPLPSPALPPATPQAGQPQAGQPLPAQSASAPAQPGQPQPGHPQSLLSPSSEGRGRSYAIGAPDENADEGPEPLDGPGGAVEVADRPQPQPMDDELPPEPLDNPRRLLVWPAPDASTQQALSDRGYRPVTVHSREEVDAQIAAFPAALFVDPLTGPITRTALQSLRQAAVAAEVPVLVTAGLGQATREAAYGADPAILLKALAPRDSEQHPPRVLLIEEREEIALALTATLERRAMQVAHARTDADAVTLAGQMRPNLVVMDLLQVRRRRAGIVDWLRANGQLNRTPLVVYTAAVDDAELPALAAGESVLFLAERSTSAEVQGRIVDLLAKIGTN
ncbi:PAS domain-containing protein [Streptomyces sp. NPDC046821]|uniref:PAS domain-containing hybrid sensor histidine kinase/response regulator n=1 Tax=Streptomyces sp. NPDC046821 TaxID=3154702 RepID=UPI0034001842